MSIIAWHCWGLGSSLAVQNLTDAVKVKDPMLVFLSEKKAGVSRIKRVQNKIKYMQGIVVQSDGRSGGLVLIWLEGTELCLKSCSHSHIDVVVRDGSRQCSWRATKFYGHLDSGKRQTSWKLLETLKNQCSMPWVVFGDFNEITHQNEKLGWLERDFKQMEGFRECLSRCGLFDLGFIGQRFTWCNGQLGDQRILLRLDRMVANSSWSELFPEARVHHRSMSNSDHCLLTLFLKDEHQRKPVKKRFQFEAMWAREEGCKEVVEGAWDLYHEGSGYSIMDKLKRCQVSLQGWNWKVFGNVNKALKQKQDRLQQIEGLNCLHEKAVEIAELRREINEMLTKKEIMWSQRSRASWIKWGDRNTKFFHATANQRCRRNRIAGIQSLQGNWLENQGDIEKTIIEYFETIFRSDHPPIFNASLCAVKQKVTQEMNEKLLEEFKAEEVRRALN